MKKVIGGRLYDTETATAIFSSITRDSMGYEVLESLYRTPNDRFFVRSQDKPNGEREDRWWVLDQGGVLEWLEGHNAPESAFLDTGIEIEKG